MKDNITSKLAIIIESTNYTSISSEVINKIDAFRKSISSNKELKLSFVHNENVETIKTNANYMRPANWDYWEV